MHFKYKCLLQQFFSALPKGERLNYYFQKNITKSLPPNNSEFLRKVRKGLQHQKNYEKYNNLAVRLNKYYEFGAGWDLTIPLTMSLSNYEVTCVDIRKLIIPFLIKNSLDKFKENEKDLPFPISIPDKLIFSEISTELRSKLNLSYLAPKDARKTDFKASSFDFISSTVTLEHIPKPDILPILLECQRLLCQGGVLSLMIDYKDHWSYFDHSISPYNFLQYSQAEWKKYNPSLHYQNRLRHSDYIEIISQTDFKIVKEVTDHPTEKEKERLKKLKLAKEFRHYSLDDLSIKRSEIVLVK